MSPTRSLIGLPVALFLVAPVTAKKVEVVRPEPADVVLRITLTGTAHADFAVGLYPKVAGFVAELAVDVGDRVAAGDLIARLDLPELEAEVPLLEARAGTAEAEVPRAEAAAAAAAAAVLEPQGLLAMLRAAKESTPDSVAEKDVAAAEAQTAKARAIAQEQRAAIDVALATLRVARAELEKAHRLLELGTIRAPFAGVVTARHADPGDLVAPGTASRSQIAPIIDLMKDDVIRLHTDVPEVSAPLVKPGSVAKIRFDAFPGREFEAAVTRTSGALAEATRTLPVQIDLDNADRAVRPGMFGRVTIDLETRNGVLTLPSSAVFESKSKHYVLVARDGVAVRVRVELGADDGVRAEIKSGLTSADQVARAGRAAAADNESVEAVIDGSGVGGGR